MPLTIFVPLSLFACRPAIDEDTALAPSPYIYADTAAPVESVDLSIVQPALQSIVDELRSLNPDPVFAIYDAVMLGKSEACPNLYSDGDGSFWYDQCASESGTHFSGYGYSAEYVDAYDDDGWVANGRGLYLAATVEDADGHEFTGAGSAYSVFGTRDGESYTSIGLQGTFTWDGEGIDGSWMAEGISPDIDETLYTNDEVNGHYFGIDGGFSPLQGDLVAVAFNSVEIADANLGSTCPIEPSGTLSVRTPDGIWIDALFDGPKDGQAAGPCDGCGTAYQKGIALGELCVDFAPLLAWSEQ